MTTTHGSTTELGDELAESTRERIRIGWAEELELPADAVAEGGEHVEVQEDLTVAVILDLFDTQVILAPPEAAERIGSLAPTERTRAAAVLPTLEPWGGLLVGETTLGYAEEVRAPLDVEVAVSPVQNVDLLREHCTAQEWEESGLIDMPSRIAARRSDGKVAAVAGFERWGRHIAQLGVLVDPRWRGQGYGAAAAARAAQVAQGDQLIPQWRCRVSNRPSRELAGRLGFVEVGRQVIVSLDGT